MSSKRDKENLNPTPEAVYAMCHWGLEYASQNGGSMDFWDSLPEHKKQISRDVVRRIREAASAQEPHP